MLKQAVESTVRFYKNMIGDIMLAVFAVAGGFTGIYLDVLRLHSYLNDTLVFGIYTLICLVAFIPLLFVVNLVRASRVRKAVEGAQSSFLANKLRLSERMLLTGTWEEQGEHSLTLINESGQDLKNCFVMLDELAWKNFNGRWEVVAREVFSQPFKWNKVDGLPEKIDLDDGDRASFALIAHKEYKIYNTTEKQDQVHTSFYFVFYGGEYSEVGYGADIRLRATIRGRLANGISFEPISYILFVHLLQAHGIPKVEVKKAKRL
jgi:hypothetical protein